MRFISTHTASALVLLCLGCQHQKPPLPRPRANQKAEAASLHATPSRNAVIKNDAPSKTDTANANEGPLDPQWPPVHPASHEDELKASELVRAQLEAGKPLPALEEPLVQGDHPGIYVEEGRIGGFDYVEVIVGPMLHPDEPMPLVILIHGRGGRPHIPEGPYPTEKPFRLWLPRGPDPLDGGYNWLATWTNSGEIDLLTRSLAARADELMPAIEAFARLNPTIGKPVVAGFSQGGILSFALATRYPSQFKAAFPIAGWLPPALIPQARDHGPDYPFIHALHGSDDITVPTAKGRDTVAALKDLGIHIEYTEVPGVAHVVTPEMNQLVRSWILAAIQTAASPHESSPHENSPPASSVPPLASPHSTAN